MLVAPWPADIYATLPQYDIMGTACCIVSYIKFSTCHLYLHVVHIYDKRAVIIMRHIKVCFTVYLDFTESSC
ncbi:hypothetical protein IMSAG192_00241 [Muribaculaceae bacterium]|nr:hypothetical protein IMSAG192_00241 [Muribaculaceae bacterium]